MKTGNIAIINMDFLILTDIMKAVLAFLWVMYIWESYLSHRQVRSANPTSSVSKLWIAGLSGFSTKWGVILWGVPNPRSKLIFVRDFVYIPSP